MFTQLEDEYYKYVAEWLKLSYEEQCEIPILTFDEWEKERKINFNLEVKY